MDRITYSSILLILGMLTCRFSHAQTIVESDFTNSQHWTVSANSSRLDISNGTLNLSTYYPSNTCDTFIRNARAYRNLCGQLSGHQLWSVKGEINFNLISSSVGMRMIYLSEDSECFYRKIDRTCNFQYLNKDEVGLSISNSFGAPQIIVQIKSGTTLVHNTPISVNLNNNTDYEFQFSRTSGTNFNVTLKEKGQSNNLINQNFSINNASDIENLNYIASELGSDGGWNRRATAKIDNLILSGDSSIIDVLRDTLICNKSSAVVFGNTISSSGLYSDTTVTSTGCYFYKQQYVRLVPPLQTIKDTFNACQGESVLFNGDPISCSGLYSSSIKAKGVNCDSIQISRLINIHPSFISPIMELVSCENDLLIYNQKRINEAGLYLDSFKSIHGCDSIIRYRVQLEKRDSTVLATLHACQGDNVNIFGKPAPQSGRYEKALLNSMGCDSLLVQNLIIHPSYSITLPKRTICPGEVINVFGNDISREGLYTRTFQSIDGCDSILQQEVTVSSVNDRVVVVQGVAYSLEDSARSYQWINCDLGILVNGANQRAFGARNDGNYAVRVTAKNGCTFTSDCIFLSKQNDSCRTIIYDTITTQVFDTTQIMVQVYDTIYRYLSVNDTLKINLNDIQGCGDIDVKLYPNPARNFVNLEVSDFDCLVLSKFNLYNSLGQILWTDQLVENRVIKIPIHTLAAGIYYIDCLDSLGNRMFVKKLVLYR